MSGGTGKWGAEGQEMTGDYKWGRKVGEHENKNL